MVCHKKSIGHTNDQWQDRKSCKQTDCYKNGTKEFSKNDQGECCCTSKSQKIDEFIFLICKMNQFRIAMIDTHRNAKNKS